MGKDDNGTPAPPDYAKLYQQGLDVYLKNLPTLISTETQYRNEVDPARIQQQQDLQQQFGATMYQQQRDALNALDPNYLASRELLRTSVTSDLAKGSSLTPEQETDFTNHLRGAQVARGNTLGNAAAMAETYGKSQYGQALYQQRLQNMGNFLAGPTPEQQLLAVQGVSPDRSMAYANPSAGAAGVNFGSQNYSNLLAANQLQQQNNPWASALGGAATGASAGSAAGPWGAVIGGVAGGALGYFSDRRLKQDIQTVGQSPSGIPIVEFSYKSDPEKKRYRGAIAQDVKQIESDAVGMDSSGYLVVDYSRIDVALCQLT